MMSFEYSDGGVDRPLWCIQSRGKIPQNRTRGRAAAPTAPVPSRFARNVGEPLAR